MKVRKEKFDELLQQMLKQKPEKTTAIKGKPGNLEPIIPAPKPSAPRSAPHKA
jgi:hypothetical protein